MEGPFGFESVCEVDADCGALLTQILRDEGSRSLALAESDVHNTLVMCFEGRCKCAWELWKGGRDCLQPSIDTVVSLGVDSSILVFAASIFLFGLYPLVALKYYGAFRMKSAERTCILGLCALIGLMVYRGHIMYIKARSTLAPVDLALISLGVGCLFVLSTVLRLAVTWMGLAGRSNRSGPLVRRILRIKWSISVVSIVWIGLAALLGVYGYVIGVAVMSILYMAAVMYVLILGAATIHFMFHGHVFSDRSRNMFFIKALCLSPFSGSWPQIPDLASSAGFANDRLLIGRPSFFSSASSRRSSSASDASGAGINTPKLFSRRILVAAFRLLICCFSAMTFIAIWAILYGTQKFMDGPQWRRLMWITWSLCQLVLCLSIFVVFWFFDESFRVRLRLEMERRALQEFAAVSSLPETNSSDSSKGYDPGRRRASSELLLHSPGKVFSPMKSAIKGSSNRQVSA